MQKPDDERLFTGNKETLQTRMNNRQCGTCIFGNNCDFYSRESAEKLEQEALAGDTMIVCHATYLPFGVDGPAAVCRGFYNRNRKALVFRLIREMFGFEMVDPPK